jgi:hypothetical protein
MILTGQVSTHPTLVETNVGWVCEYSLGIYQGMDICLWDPDELVAIEKWRDDLLNGLLLMLTLTMSGQPSHWLRFMRCTNEEGVNKDVRVQAVNHELHSPL